MLALLLLAPAADELQLARGYFERGMYEEAASGYARVPAQTEESRFYRAEALYRARKWKEALMAFEAFSKAHSKSKKKELASLRKAICLTLSGEKDGARKELENSKLRGQMADVAAYYLQLAGGRPPAGGGAYSCLARGEAALAAGEYDKASEELSTASKSAPKALEPRIKFAMAEARRLKGEIDAAAKLYSELEGLTPLAPLGLAACRLARGEFGKALGLAPKVSSPDAAYIRAASLLGLGRFSRAAAALEGLELGSRRLLLRVLAVYYSGRTEEAAELAGGLQGAWAEFVRAEGLRTQGRRAQAAELYSRVDSPALKPYAAFGLASCAFESGKYEEAARLFTGVSEPRLKDAALVKAGEAFLLAKKPRPAEKALAEVRENSELYACAQWRLCIAAHARGDWRALAERCRRLASSRPRSKEAHDAGYWLARSQAALGDWAGARDTLRALLRSGAGESTSKARNELAFALFKLGQLDAAERAWRELKPEALTGATLLWLGRRSLGRNEAKKAKRALALVLAAEAGRDEVKCRALYELGALLLEEGDVRGADDHLARALALRPAQPLRVKARLARGKTLLARGKLEEAEGLFSNVVAESEGLERGEAYLGLGKVLFRRRELAAARDAFVKVVVLFPGAPEGLRAEALLGAGKALDALGLHEKAGECYDEILQRYPKSPQAEEARRLLGE